MIIITQTAPQSPRMTNMGNGNGRVPPRIATTLIQLADAHQCAVSEGYNVWEFAVEIGVLNLHPTDVRFLIHKGLVEHGWETTRPGAKCRSFRPDMGITLSQRSCFIATAAGLSLARACVAAAAKPSRAALDANGNGHAESLSGPHWDAACRTLCVDGKLVKQFRRPARSQEKILAAFQESGWPSSIDDPLSGVTNDGRSRLRCTLYNLNRCQRNRLVHFWGSADGRRVAWRRVGAHRRRRQ